MMSNYVEHLEAEYQRAKYEYETLQAAYGDTDPMTETAYYDMQQAYNDLQQAQSVEEDPQMTTQNSPFQEDDDMEDIYTEPTDEHFDYTCSLDNYDSQSVSQQVEEWELNEENNVSIDPNLQSSSEDDELFCEDEGFCYGRLACGPTGTVVVPGDNETESQVGQKLLTNSKVKAAVSYNTSNHPTMVKDLEKALHTPYWERSPTGEYTEALVQRIGRLQQDANNRQRQNTKVKDRLVCPRVDGKLDKDTQNYIKVYYFSNVKDEGQVFTKKIWPHVDWTEEKKFDHYAAICKQFDHEVKSGSVTLLAIRGVMLFAAKSRRRIGDHAKAYDDSFILLDYRAGNKKVREFSGATHAYQATSSASPNADGSGKADVGSIRENDGKSLYKITKFYKKKGGYNIGIVTGEKPIEGITWSNGYVPAYRDTDHNQSISKANKTNSKNRNPSKNRNQDMTRQIVKGLGDYSTGVLFHPGYTALTGKGVPFSSISCQTARAEDVEFLAQVADKAGHIDYLLVEATDVVPPAPKEKPKQIFFKDIKELEEAAIEEGVSLHDRITAFRLIFYPNYPLKEYAGAKIGGGAWSMLIEGAKDAKKPKAWASSTLAPVEKRVRNNQVVTPDNNIPNSTVDIGHMFAGVDAANHPAKVELAGGMIKFQSNVEASTYVGDLGSVVATYIKNSPYSFYDTARNRQTLLESYYDGPNAMASAEDMAGNLDAYVIKISGTVWESMESYYVTDKLYKNRYKKFVQKTNPQGNKDRLVGEVFNAALAFAAGKKWLADVALVLKDPGPGLFAPTFWECYWNVSKWVVEIFLDRTSKQK